MINFTNDKYVISKNSFDRNQMKKKKTTYDVIIK